MVGNVVRFTSRPARQAAATASEFADLVRGSDALSDAEVAIALRVAAKVSRSPATEALFWQGVHTMLNREQTAAAWAAIRALPARDRPQLVRRVFDDVILTHDFDTGEVPHTRDQIAERVGALPRHVSAAMSVLERIGVIVRQHERSEGQRGRGRVVYSINPHVVWTGSLAVAAQRAKALGCGPVQLRLVE